MLLCFGHRWRRISNNFGNPVSKNSYHYSGPSTIERTLDLPRHKAARALPLVINGVSCGSLRKGRGGDRCNQRRSQVGLIKQSNTHALRTLKERLPSGVPKEEFGRMIFEKISFIGDRTKVKSTPSAAARGDEAWRWIV